MNTYTHTRHMHTHTHTPKAWDQLRMMIRWGQKVSKIQRYGMSAMVNTGNSTYQT